MGISDEDYANALEHQRLHQVALIKLEIQKQQEEAKMSISGMTGLGNLVGAMGQGALQSNGTNQYQGQQAYNSAATQTAYASTTSMPLTGTISTQLGSVYSGVRPIREDELKHDAMLAPLSALVDMWLVRWQGEWVNEQEFQEDEFWRLALIRLVGANKLEKHNLANQYHSVYRIIE